MGSLPSAFPNGPAQVMQGPHPQIIPTGGLPYRMPAAGQIAQGAQAFVDNFLQAKQARQNEFKGRFWEGVQAKMMGIPTNDQEIMKWGKKGGIPLPTEPYTPEQLQGQADQKYMQTAMQMGGSPMLGGPTGAAPQPPSPAPQQAQPGAPPPIASGGSQGLPEAGGMSGQGALAAMAAAQAGAAAQGGVVPQQPSMLQNLARKMGFSTGPISTNSPAGDWLKSLGAAAQGGGLAGQTAVQTGQLGLTQLEQQFQKNTGIPLNQLNAQQQAMMIGLVRKGLAGDPQALEMLSRSGMWKDMPGDDIARFMSMTGMDPGEARDQTGKMMLWLSGGGPQMKIRMLDMAKDMKDNFGGDVYKALNYLNDPTRSPFQPGMTADQFEKFSNGMSNLEKNYNAPAYLSFAYGTAAMQGNKDLQDSIMKAVTDHYKPAGAVQQGQFATTSSISQQDANAASLRALVERGNLELARGKAVAENATEDEKMALDQLQNNKNLTDAERLRYTNIVTSAANRKSSVMIPYGSGQLPLGNYMRTALDKTWGLLGKGAAGGLGYTIGGKPEVELSTPDNSFWGGQTPLDPSVRLGLALRGLTEQEQVEVLKNSGYTPQMIQSLLMSKKFPAVPLTPPSMSQPGGQPQQ